MQILQIIYLFFLNNLILIHSFLDITAFIGISCVIVLLVENIKNSIQIVYSLSGIRYNLKPILEAYLF